MAGHREIRFRQKGSVAISQHHRGEAEPGAREINFPVTIQVRGDMRVSEERIILGRKGGGLRQRACRRGKCHQGEKSERGSPVQKIRNSAVTDERFFIGQNAAVQSLAAIKEK